MKKTYNFDTVLVLVLVLIYCEQSFADEVYNQQITNPAIDLEKKQVEKIVEKMVRSGRLSREQAENARREIAAISNHEMEIVKKSVARNIASTDE